jgi:hypothetical protein
MLAVSPGTMEPRLHVIVLVLTVQLPKDTVIGLWHELKLQYSELISSCDGKESVKTTSVAVITPLLVTVAV